MVERLQQIGDQLRDIEVSLKGRDQRLEGRIRLAIPDVLAVNFLLNELAEFTDTYPGIDLELMPGYQNLDPARGEIDIVIRATETPPEVVVTINVPFAQSSPTYVGLDDPAVRTWWNILPAADSTTSATPKSSSSVSRRA